MVRLIDADALKLSHCKECTMYPDKCMGKDCDWGAIIHINAMPTIDAEPVKHGKWIEGKCNRCGEHAPYWSMATTYYRSNYCPNCGCRMDQ